MSGSAARADFVIDNFSVPATQTSYSFDAVGTYTLSPPDTIAPGVTRTTTITLLSGPTPNAVNGVLGGGEFTLNTAVSSRGYANLSYSYATPQDLSASGPDVIFSFINADVNTPFSIRVTDANGASSVQSGVITASGSGTDTLPVSGFTGVDLSHVTSVVFELNRDMTRGDDSVVTAADVALGGVQFGSVVPAPPAAVLGLIAIPALGLWRYSRRRAAAA